MASENVNIRITGELKKHLLQQTGTHGLYENSSEYIRALIRQDLQSRQEARDWLRQELEPALRASQDDYHVVTAADVISRNKRKRND